MTKQTKHLVPCPICQKPPEQLIAGEQGIRVIHCPRGCKASVFAPVVHITSWYLRHPGCLDIVDAWNTIRIKQDDSGKKYISFDAYPPASPANPENFTGSFLEWSPAISAEKRLARATLAKHGGV